MPTRSSRRSFGGRRREARHFNSRSTQPVMRARHAGQNSRCRLDLNSGELVCQPPRPRPARTGTHRPAASPCPAPSRRWHASQRDTHLDRAPAACCWLSAPAHLARKVGIASAHAWAYNPLRQQVMVSREGAAVGPFPEGVSDKAAAGSGAHVNRGVAEARTRALYRFQTGGHLTGR